MTLIITPIKRNFLRPVQMFVKKAKGILVSRRMPSVKELNIGFVNHVELIVQKPDFGILIGDPFVWLNKIVVTSLNHEWPGEDKIRHFRVTVGATHVKIWHFPFDGMHEAVVKMRVRHFARPVAEVGRADRQAITFKHRRHAHRGFSTVTLAIESYPITVDERQLSKPAKRLIVLRKHKCKQCLLQGICLPVEPAITVLSTENSVGRINDEALIGKLCADVIVTRVALDHDLGYAVSPVLYDDHRSFFSGREVFRYKQHAG
jgi:hypothetical protein